MDRLDRLTQRLIDEMDQQTDRASRDCLELVLLELFATGDVDLPTRGAQIGANSAPLSFK